MSNEDVMKNRKIKHARRPRAYPVEMRGSMGYTRSDGALVRYIPKRVFDWEGNPINTPGFTPFRIR